MVVQKYFLLLDKDSDVVQEAHLDDDPFRDLDVWKAYTCTMMILRAFDLDFKQWPEGD